MTFPALPAMAAGLAAEIRTCGHCDAPERICLVHMAALDTLYPQRCTDPDCYACVRGAER